MGFWQQVFSPGGLVAAVVAATVGALLSHALTRRSRERDEKLALIRDVAEKYRQLCEAGRTSGVDGPLKSGVCRLSTGADVEQTIALIKDLGQSDPLASLRQKLAGKDVLDFFLRMRDGHLRPFKLPDLEKAIAEAKRGES